jgi:hypothetical protein
MAGKGRASPLVLTLTRLPPTSPKTKKQTEKDILKNERRDEMKKMLRGVP